MADYPFIHTVRYMGNKGKLLDKIIPKIEELTNKGDPVCDLMAGTNAIGYALKGRNKVVSNDIQYYSFVIANCMLSSFIPPSDAEIKRELDPDISENREKGHFKFFTENYTDTYFSSKQCEDIDSIRYAIERSENPENKYFYLVLLMNAMCKAQSTTGHFAQFMNKEHKRVQPLRAMSVYDLFFEKVKDFSSFLPASYENVVFNMDYKELLTLDIMDDVKCFYLDSPYTNDQYSRFYHILETVCKYDSPKLEYKAKYRTDRHHSGFCYKKTAPCEFENIISFCRKKNAPLVISYSNHGVISPETVKEIGERYYGNVTLEYVDFEHSSQGKGSIGIKEIILTMKL